LLGVLPQVAREKMKMILEASAVADLEKTFKKFAPTIIAEIKQPHRAQLVNGSSLTSTQLEFAMVMADFR
jgi:hypothetical protein